jgi:hypothetical protein
VQPGTASGEQIVAILRVGFVPNVISIYQGGAAEWQSVQPHAFVIHTPSSTTE